MGRGEGRWGRHGNRTYQGVPKELRRAVNVQGGNGYNLLEIMPSFIIKSFRISYCLSNSQLTPKAGVLNLVEGPSENPF